MLYKLATNGVDLFSPGLQMCQKQLSIARFIDISKTIEYGRVNYLSSKPESVNTTRFIDVSKTTECS